MELKALYLTFIALIHLSKAQFPWDITDMFGVIDDPDSKLNVSQLISSKGYPVEEHHVQTKDGYILGLQRIPAGRRMRDNPKLKKKPILLQHGLLSCSTDWVINFPDQSLGFILADAGYDVWLGNIRGNTYSRRHVKYSPKSKEFWNFSFDEMAEYDLPAMIDYILEITGEQQIYYVGHSQGTTIPFALLSQSEEYNKKIKLFVGLAPVAGVAHIETAIRYLCPFTDDLDFLMEILGVSEFLPSNSLMLYLSEYLCETKLKFICSDIIFLMAGTDTSQLNETRLGVYIAHTPSGASTQSIIHYAQLCNSKKFQKFDYGEKGNILHYNQTSPPEYHLENITANIAMYWSENDKLADPTDVHILQGQLKSLVASTMVKMKEFNHLDFVWAVDAHKLLYDDVLNMLSKF